MGDPIAKIIKMGGRIKQKKVPTTAYETTKQQKREYCERNNINIPDADWWQLCQNATFEYLKIKGGK